MHVLIFKLNIIYYNQSNFYQYLKLAIVIFVVINPNNTRNVILFYCNLGYAIDFISVSFSLVFKVYFDRFSKLAIINVIISIFLKYIRSNLIMIFISYRNF